MLASCWDSLKKGSRTVGEPAWRLLTVTAEFAAAIVPVHKFAHRQFSTVHQLVQYGSNGRLLCCCVRNQQPGALWLQTRVATAIFRHERLRDQPGMHLFFI